MTIAALASCLFVSPPDTSGESSERALTLWVFVYRQHSGEPFLRVRGNSIPGQPPGKFRVFAWVTRVPCPGFFRYKSGGEDESNGNTSSYFARVRLFRFEPDLSSAPCGQRPPAKGGRGEVRLTGASGEPLFDLSAHRPGRGRFTGSLDLAETPACGERYALTVKLDLGKWRRSYSYRVSVDGVETGSQGRPPESECD